MRYIKKSTDHEEESFFISMTDIMWDFVYFFNYCVLLLSKKRCQAKVMRYSAEHGIRILKALKKF